MSKYCAIHVELSLIVICFFLLGGSLLLARKNKSLSDILFGGILALFFSAIGIYLEEESDSSKKDTYFSNFMVDDSISYLHLQLIDAPIKTAKWVKGEAAVLALNDSATTGKIQFFIARDSASEILSHGDLIYAGGFINPIQGPSNPHEFDYSSYMRLHDIHHQIFIRENQWRYSGRDANPVFEQIYAIRDHCLETFEKSGMRAESIAVAKALVIGDKTLISDELMLSFAATGALHVLAVSGLHVGIIMLILGFILKPVRRLKKGKILFLVLVLVGIWFYAILTGLTPSVLRAAVMFSFVLIGNEIQRDTSIYQSLMVSALILILLDPQIIFQLGFLLSYFAVIGIVFFHPKLYALLFFKNKIADKIWQITCVSIAAQLATFPLGIYCFQQFPNYFLIANLLVIPLSFLILIIGITALFFSAVPILNSLIFKLLDFFIHLLNEGVKFIERLPYAVFDSLVITWYDAVFLYIFLLFISHAILKKSKITMHFAFLFLTLFLTSDLLKTTSKINNKQVVFYKIKDQVLVDFITGTTFRSIGNQPEQVQTSDMKFHVQPNRIQLCGKIEADVHTTLSDSVSTFSFCDKTIFFANQNQVDAAKKSGFPKTSATYFYHCKFLPDPIIQSIIENKTLVILGPGCTNGLKKHLAQSLQNFQIHDIHKSGALVVSF